MVEFLFRASCYFFPVFPLLTRLVLCLRWRKQMSEELSEAAQERDVSRTFIFSLAGFSFTAVAGLAVLDSEVRVSLQLPTWYVLASFVAFISSVNVQSYKVTRWQNQLATALLEVGTFCLMLALVDLLFTAKFAEVFQWVAMAVTLGAWGVDHVLRIKFDNDHLADL